MHSTDTIPFQQRSSENKRTLLSYPIVVLTLCAAFLFYKYILQNFPSVIATQLMTDFEIQGLGLGMLSGVYFWTYLIVPLFVGILIDRYGARWITTGAIFCCALGVFWFSQAHALSMAVLARALIGIGVSFATIAYMKLAATWFAPHKYALLVGLIVTAAMTGAVCGQMPLAWLIHHAGWRTGLAEVGIGGFILALGFMLIVRDAPQKMAEHTRARQSAFSLSEILAVFKSKQNWLLMLYSGLSFSPVVIFGGLWGNPFLQSAYNLDPLQTSSLISLIFIGLGIGGPLFAIFAGWMSSKKQLMLYSTLASAAMISLVLYAHPMPTWCVACLLFGFGLSLGPFSLVFVIGKELNPLHLAGTAMAMINASEALLDAVTEPMVGKILDVLSHPTMLNGAHHFSLQAYHIALIILPLYQVIGSLVLIWVKEKH